MGIPQSNRRRGARAANNPEAYAYYEPADHNVATVVAHVQDHPEQREAILAAEIAGKNRSTLVAQLQAEQE